MTQKIRRVVPAPVKSLQVRVEQWRGSKGKEHRMPKVLWEEAAKLAGQYGVNLVSKFLALGYVSLKQKTQGNWGPVKKGQSVETNFVDITTSSISRSSLFSSNEMELHRPDGHRVLIRNADRDCVLQVTGAFFGRMK